MGRMNVLLVIFISSLRAAFQHLKGATRQLEREIFARACSDRTGVDGFKLKDCRFRWDTIWFEGSEALEQVAQGVVRLDGVEMIVKEHFPSSSFAPAILGVEKKKCFKMSSGGGFNWKNELQGFYFLGYCSVCPPLSYWVRPCFQCMAFNVGTPVLLTQGSPRVRSHNQKNPAKAVMKGSDCNPHTSLWNTWSLCWTVAVQTKSDHNQSL